MARFALLPWVALWSLLSWLTAVEAINIRELCDNGDVDDALRMLCETLDGVYTPENDVTDWDDAYGRRQIRSAVGERAPRADNYIRFGRSVVDLSADPSVRRTLLASFGAPARRTSSGHYMRFGRSTDHVTGGGEVEKRFMRFGKRDGDDDGDGDADGDERFMRMERPFMRFGRSRVDDDDDADAKRGFMRFGRPAEGDETKRAFMRFGRAESGADVDADVDDKRAFMRFGKRFMRFGRTLRADGSPEAPVTDEYPEDGPAKRAFMRFGKRGFMRFGRDPGNPEIGDPDEKRFMRFGRRPGGEEPEDGGAEKRFMRFGKRAFMRFGRRQDPDVAGKRFMRFGKRRQQPDDADQTGRR